MINNRLRITDDGSHTIYSDEAGENYHSSYGAIQESEHVFIGAGLNTVADKALTKVRILEIGTGTGLNILLSYLWSVKNRMSIEYHGYEPFPIKKSEALKLNYPKQLNIDSSLLMSIHNNVHGCVNLSEKFKLLMNKTAIAEAVLPSNFYNVIFFDAFSPEAQPEMWTPDIFTEIYRSLRYSGVLTTYCCKGSVKRALKESGFEIEKLSGPPGKREFLRAWKLENSSRQFDSAIQKEQLKGRVKH